MNFGEAVKSFWSNYFVFEGRASRSEFWYAMLFLFLLAIPVAWIEGIPISFLEWAKTPDGYGLPTMLFSIAVFLPSLTLAWRRLQDLDKSGFWNLIYFIPLVGFIILIIWYSTKGTQGVNRYGDDPLQ